MILNSNYSTTRLVSKKEPVIINNTKDEFETVLFLPPNPHRRAEGGLRTKGYFKFSYENLIMNDKFLILNDKNGNEFKLDNSTFNIQHSTFRKLPLISIITVVYNGEKYLEETIQSVINQTYPNVEYIIIDGGSTDGTIDIIKKYEDKIDYWVSEPDDGIYDAMNKGIDLATGKWINFMNAGDRFFTHNTVKDIFLHSRDLDSFDILYGDLIVDYGEFQRFVKVKPLYKLWQGMAFSHQSAFARTYLQKKYKYKLGFSIAADFDFFYNAYINGKSFYYISIPFSIMIADGLADINRINSISQWHSIVDKSNFNMKYNIYYFLIYINQMLKIQLKKILPIKIINFLKEIK